MGIKYSETNSAQCNRGPCLHSDTIYTNMYDPLKVVLINICNNTPQNKRNFWWTLRCFALSQVRLMEYRISWDLRLLRMSIVNYSDCIDEGRSPARSRWCHALAGVLDRVGNANWAPLLSSCECHTLVTFISPP